MTLVAGPGAHLVMEGTLLSNIPSTPWRVDTGIKVLGLPVCFPGSHGWVEHGQLEYLGPNSERRTSEGPQGDGRRMGGPLNGINPIATMNQHGAVGLASRPSSRAALGVQHTCSSVCYTLRVRGLVVVRG